MATALTPGAGQALSHTSSGAGRTRQAHPEQPCHDLPADLKYTDEHQWVRAEAGRTLAVGITDYGQNQLEEIVSVELPQVGKRVKAGDAVGVIESVKVASDFHSPVTGEVVAINTDAADAPEEVNGDAYGVWLFKIKLADGASTDNLLDAAALQEADRLTPLRGATARPPHFPLALAEAPKSFGQPR
ncbi:glycine cleavage system protein GcvH [Streptomyces puniciscabiei]